MAWVLQKAKARAEANAGQDPGEDNITEGFCHDYFEQIVEAAQAMLVGLPAKTMQATTFITCLYTDMPKAKEIIKLYGGLGPFCQATDGRIIHHENDKNRTHDYVSLAAPDDSEETDAAMRTAWWRPLSSKEHAALREASKKEFEAMIALKVIEPVTTTPRGQSRG